MIQSTNTAPPFPVDEQSVNTAEMSNISSLLRSLKRDDESIVVDTLQELQKVASQIVDSLFLQSKDLIVSTFNKIGIAFNAVDALFNIIKRDPPALTLLPSPIFSSSSPYQQYSDFSFLDAMTKKLRTVFAEFQTNLPTDPSRLQKYAKLTKNDRFIITRSLDFCSHSFNIPTLLLAATPPIEVDSEIIRELFLFVKEGLTTILTNISTIDNLIYPLIRVSVFEPAKPFIIFIFTNSNKLILSEIGQSLHNRYLNRLYYHTKEMEIRSDEHDVAIVSALVKWETRTMVEMESEERCSSFFAAMLNRTTE
ncbi:hypothetical protein BLNAU_6906 [Blattamonas nauphoetae]|uniref:Uncharacterized protein n=1 Tax=Blattamonas nauphoetae TaxID=2049346 RepID=A0ABQ9Y381_9EUKA|nr:hypothetical protein BLNAU_6906 [Blattamonas nauphoetae]